MPVVAYVHLAGEGLGWQSLDMLCLDHCFNHFEFPYIGLPALDGREYVEQANPIAWALTGLMNVPAEERARIKAESLRRAARAKLSDRQRFVVVECVESFTTLDANQLEEFEGLVELPTYQEVREMQKTTYEKGVEAGVEQGARLAECRWLMLQLEEKFGSVPEKVRKKIEQLSGDERQQVARQLLSAERLKDLQF